MSNDLNRAEFIGRLGKDPELKSLPSGDAVVNMSIAVGSSWKDKTTGEKKERTEWVPLVAFKGLAEICAKYLKKGSQVYVAGRFKTRKWTDKEGKDRYMTEVEISEMQMIGGKPAGSSSETRSEPAQAPAARAPAKDGFEDDDIPF